jgi:phage/plasmid primase-like uncharacterized protein
MSRALHRNRYRFNALDWQKLFNEALRTRGLQLPRGENLIADGEPHRLDVTDQRAGNQNGSYILQVNPIPHGGYNNWTDGKKYTGWRATLPNGYQLTAAEQREIDRAGERARDKESKLRKKVQAEAAVKARSMWKKAAPASKSFPYCKRKLVDPVDLRTFTFSNRDQTLLVPAYDEKDRVQSLQLIQPDGKKRFLKGSRAAVSHFWICHPDADAVDDPDRIFICEGWATGESIYQATGCAVLMAFYAENLHEVAKWAREQYPDAKLTICADDDWETKRDKGYNPGLDSADEAAGEIDALVAVPDFGDERTDEQGKARTDFNDMHAAFGLDAVKQCIADAADPPSGDDSEGGNREQRETQASLLLELVPQGSLFRTRDQASFADIIVNDHRETWSIKSTSFRRWLIHQYFLLTKCAPGAEAVRQAVEMTEAKALFGEDVPVREVFIRVGGHDGAIYIDLCDEDWRVVKVTADGWSIVNDPPVRFRRKPGMLPLREPKRGGSIEDLRPFVNVKAAGAEKQISDTDFVLLVAWLLAALREFGPYPILKVYGEHGATKSTLTRLLRALTDPHKSEARQLPRENRDLFIAANNAWVQSYDNVSSIPEWMSNALCVISTGGGFATRSLYTDEDEQLFEAQRPTILNGIENFVTKHDLADRTILMELPFVPKQQRRREKEFWADFEAKRPGILGALLDVVVHGLKTLPDVAEEDWPRMADFAHWITACEGALWEAGTFRKAYAAKSQESQLERDR